MWLLSEGSQAAETASLSPCSVEQPQSRWSGGGTDYNGSGNYEDRIRAIIPPAFRSANAKVLWDDPCRSLEANVNEALGLTGWSTASGCQFNEPDTSNVSSQYPAGFAAGAPGGWNQTDLDQQQQQQQRAWEVPNHVTVSSPSMRGGVGYCGNGVPAKCWPPAAEELTWGNPGGSRPPTVPCCPPPLFAAPNGGWQGPGARNAMFAPPPARFAGAGFDGSMGPGGTGGAWVPRGAPNTAPLAPPTAMPPPPQRSRFQSMWATNANVNGGPASGLCMPPPGMDFSVPNVPNGICQWTPPATVVGGVGGGAMKAQQPQHISHFPTRSSPPMPVGGTFNLPPASNSSLFMGEDSMWQDPNGEVRKWQRDTGTSIWGNPEKQNGDIRRWLVPAGVELESANESGVTAAEESTATTTPRDSTDSAPVTSTKSRSIVPMGWGDLPAMTSAAQKSSSNTVVADASSTLTQNTTWSTPISQPSNPSGSWDSRVPAVKSPAGPGVAWGDVPLVGEDHLRARPAAVPTVPPNSWTSPMGPQPNNFYPPDANMNAATQLVAQQLRNAIAKGLIDFSLISKPLPNETLSLINSLLARLPVLDHTEQELAALLSFVKIQGEASGAKGDTVPMMSVEQRAEHDRLVSEIAATKNDIAAIRDKIRDAHESLPPTLNNDKTSAVCGDVSATSGSAARFGDSLLDAAVSLEQPKPLFSIF